MAPVLEVSGLTTVFRTRHGPVRAVQDVSFSVEAGETLAIVGESGCGKTMTALSLMRLVPPPGDIAGGSVMVDGVDLMALGAADLRRMRGSRIAMIFQEPMTALNPLLTVGRQIAEMVSLHENVSRRTANARAVDMLHHVRIPAPERRAREYPHQMSGGMRQRAMIAMALACKPKVLIADEPTTALDVTIQAQILNLLRELVAEENAALIMITHDLGVVAGMCERVHVMYAGMFMETGTTRQLFAKPRHPYTLGLLQSIPRLDAARKARLHPIEGAPRDMLHTPAACPFQPRCRFEVEASSQEVPRLEEIERGHKVACFSPVPEDEWQNLRKQVVAP